MIVFESNYDGKLQDIYKGYKQRWEIETLFLKNKNIIQCSKKNVHGAYRMISTEFINFISCIMISRIKKVIDASQECQKYSLPKIMRFLTKYVKNALLKSQKLGSIVQH